MNIHRILIIFLFFFSFDSMSMTMGQAINEAGRQRMLSQKVAKAYFMRAIHPNSSSASHQMQTSIKMFEYNLQRLKKFQKAKVLNPQLEVVDDLWQQYKVAMQQPATRENCKQILRLSEEVLAQANHYVKNLQDLSGTKAAELINISGRQRMLSQRMTKNFLASYWRKQEVNSDSLFYLDLAEFENSLLYLLKNPQNTPEITKKLHHVKGRLDYASRAFDGGIDVSGDRIIFMVIGTTDSMLYKMNEITALYAALLND